MRVGGDGASLAAAEALAAGALAPAGFDLRMGLSNAKKGRAGKKRGGRRGTVAGSGMSRVPREKGIFRVRRTSAGNSVGKSAAARVVGGGSTSLVAAAKEMMHRAKEIMRWVFI